MMMMMMADDDDDEWWWWWLMMMMMVMMMTDDDDDDWWWWWWLMMMMMMTDDDDDDDDWWWWWWWWWWGCRRQLKRHFSQVIVSIRLSVSSRSHNILRLFCSSKRSCLTVNNTENKKLPPARSFLEFHPYLEKQFRPTDNGAYSAAVLLYRCESWRMTKGMRPNYMLA